MTKRNHFKRFEWVPNIERGLANQVFEEVVMYTLLILLRGVNSCREDWYLIDFLGSIPFALLRVQLFMHQ